MGIVVDNPIQFSGDQVMIRRNWIAFVASAVVLVGATWFAVAQAGEEKSRPGPEGTSQQLRQRLEELEARVAQLEQRAALPAFPAHAIPQSYVVPQGTPPSVPEGSIPREFNGMRYYIVPLDKSAPAR